MTVTTTHDPFGGGRPRLIFAAGGSCSRVVRPREFDLLAGVTLIGSSNECHLVLSGTAARHAEIRRTPADEYRFIPLDWNGLAAVNGRHLAEPLLRSGSRIEIGPFTLTFFREEFADHGRPYGGRQGGEGSIQRHQQFPRHRGTTPKGGCAPKDGDCGEYF